MGPVSSKLVTLILLIVAISLLGYFVCHRQNAIKRFFKINPKSIPSVSSGQFFNNKRVLIEIMVDRSAELALQEAIRSDLDNV